MNGTQKHTQLLILTHIQSYLRTPVEKLVNLPEMKNKRYKYNDNEIYKPSQFLKSSDLSDDDYNF